MDAKGLAAESHDEGPSNSSNAAWCPASVVSGHGASAKTVGRTTTATATFPATVRENEEVVPVNAVSTWVLPSGVAVGR